MKNNKLFGGVLLITGTTIGAAMLALPVSTGLIGFFPAVATFFVCWAMMLWSAYLFVEVNLSIPGQINLISMADKTLGSVGKAVAWVGFLALLYSLLSAYMTGSGQLMIDLLEGVLKVDLPDWLLPLPILFLFGPCIYFGVWLVDLVNRYLMFGLVFVYVVMISLLLNHLDPQLLLHVDLDQVFFVFPVVFVSFGYHIIIPSLTAYLDRDVKQIKRCILWGSLLPIAVYLIWEILILGTIPPSGENSIAMMLKNNTAPANVLTDILENNLISFVIQVFSLFAIVTSFIGVAQSMFDFLSDGLKQNEKAPSRWLVLLLTFVPPVIFVAVFQKGFVVVLEYAGLIIAVIMGIIPILMVWSCRHWKKYTSPFHAPGGRTAFVLGIIFYIMVISLLIATKTGWVQIHLEQYLP